VRCRARDPAGPPASAGSEEVLWYGSSSHGGKAEALKLFGL
jgi:hypothetical protein